MCNLHRDLRCFVCFDQKHRRSGLRMLCQFVQMKVVVLVPLLCLRVDLRFVFGAHKFLKQHKCATFYLHNRWYIIFCVVYKSMQLNDLIKQEGHESWCTNTDPYPSKIVFSTVLWLKTKAMHWCFKKVAMFVVGPFCKLFGKTFANVAYFSN